MRKANGVVRSVVAVLVGIVLTGAPPLDAQTRSRSGSAAPFLPLVGPGSAIGITIRDVEAGVIVEDVREGRPAARAGVKQEDVVINFDGERVRSAAQFTRLVRETAPGHTVEMTVTRGGARQTFDVMPEPQRAADFGVPNLAWSIRPALPRGFTFDFDGRPLLGALSPRRLGVTVSPGTPHLVQVLVRAELAQLLVVLVRDGIQLRGEAGAARAGVVQRRGRQQAEQGIVDRRESLGAGAGDRLVPALEAGRAVGGVAQDPGGEVPAGADPAGAREDVH
jgi:membrane-associated protease RseP (regulator of RpoE activity)